LDAAQLAFCKAERWDRQNAAMPSQLSHLFLLRRDGEQAAEWAQKALALDPESGKAKELLADALIRLGKVAEAKKYWFEAAGLNPMIPSEARGLFARELRQAEAAAKTKDFVSAERFYRRAAALDQENVRALTGLCHALFKLGDGEAAVTWGRKAVLIAPRDVEARLTLGDALAKTGETKGALAEWREASLLSPNHRGAQIRLRRAGQ
jgi:tetratricopeptide (TPR) repeat protein